MMTAINATNLHVGGGVQVAVSFLSELSRLPDLACTVDVWASSEVDHNLRELRIDTGVFNAYSVRDNQGVRQLWNGFNRVLRRYDTVFTVFGPLYALRAPRRSIVGFAQGWIAYPRSDAYALLSTRSRWLARLRFRLQAFFYQKADRLIVELPHVRDRLRTMGWSNPVDVVANCISDIFFDPTRWHPVSVPCTNGIKLGILSRDYPNKNLSILPSVKRYLKNEYGLDVAFLVTLSKNEWRSRDEDFRSQILNVGPLSVAQCPSFYKQLDGFVFPSLLESFSASPIEALAMGLPVFASDRPFVRDTCGDAPVYFDPGDPRSIAASIAGYFKAPRPRSTCLPADYTDPTVRARRYMDIVRGGGFNYEVHHC